jgi:DNA-binding transcriptional MocR family regulator
MLPPERELAGALSVSRATIVSTYQHLKADGWLESRRGSGTWVPQNIPFERHDGVDAVSTAQLFLSDDGREQRSGPGEYTNSSGLIDLSVAALTCSPAIERILCSLTPEDLHELTSHHGYLPHGLHVLRDTVAQRFSAQGLATTADNIVITTGAHQAISLVCRQLLQAGDTVIVESPTFPGALDVFRRFGARTLPLPVDDDGARVDVLPELLARAKPKMLYIAPQHNNPTGVVLSYERRVRIAELAALSKTIVLEDHAMADVVLTRGNPIPPIAALNDTARIHTIGSASKLFWAGLRVGWVRSPDDFAARMLATKTVADLGNPLIEQLLTHRLLSQIDLIQEERRQELLPRLKQLTELIDTLLPGFTWTTPSGGLSLWVTMPSGNAVEFAETARECGVIVVPGPALSVDGGNRRSLRIVFSATEAALNEGVCRLSDAWKQYTHQQPRQKARLLV